MNKIIINNKTKLNDEVALKLVLSVIAKGRISNDGKCYCYASLFRISKDETGYRQVSSPKSINKLVDVYVYAEKRKNDIFTIVDNREI